MNQNGASKTDTLVKLVLVVFVSLLAFSVGTYVGKNVTDSQYRQAKLETEYKGRETASIPNDAINTAPESALSDSDIQKLADEFNKEDNATKKEVPPATDKPAHEGKMEAKAEEKTEAKVPAKQIQPETKTIAKAETKEIAKETHHQNLNEKRSPSSLPAAVASSVIGKYTIQVASYPTEKEAEQYASDLKNKGFEAFYIPAEIKGKTWYRVSIGNYSTRAEASKRLENVKKQAELKNAIIQKIIE